MPQCAAGHAACDMICTEVDGHYSYYTCPTCGRSIRIDSGGSRTYIETISSSRYERSSPQPLFQKPPPPPPPPKYKTRKRDWGKINKTNFDPHKIHVDFDDSVPYQIGLIGFWGRRAYKKGNYEEVYKKADENGFLELKAYTMILWIQQLVNKGERRKAKALIDHYIEQNWDATIVIYNDGTEYQTNIHDYLFRHVVALRRHMWPEEDWRL